MRSSTDGGWLGLGRSWRDGWGRGSSTQNWEKPFAGLLCRGVTRTPGRHVGLRVAV